MMKKFAVIAATALAALGMSPAAHAADTISLTPTTTGSAGSFGNVVSATGAFSNTFTFNLAQAGTLSSSLTTTGHNAATQLTFGSAFLNGTPFQVFNLPLPNGNFGFGFLINSPVSAGLQTLVVNGTSGGSGSYGGNVTFTSAVPEPGTWALMIIGFGMAGYALRRRRREDLGNEALPALA